MKLRIYFQEPGADEGEPRDGLFVQYKSARGVPLPAVGDSFMIKGMENSETIAQRTFRYKADGDLDVILYP